MRPSLAPILWALALLSPVAASVVAAFCYARHRRVRPDPARRFPPVAYVLVLLVVAVIAFPVGLIFGINWACGLPSPGNLCGLWGVFVAGPCASAAAILLVGAGVALVPADVDK